MAWPVNEQWREFLGVPGKIRDARNLERLDQLHEAEKKRLLGADLGQQIVADELQAKWPEMEAGVQAVLLATDGSRISEHPEEALGRLSLPSEVLVLNQIPIHSQASCVCVARLAPIVERRWLCMPA